MIGALTVIAVIVYALLRPAVSVIEREAQRSREEAHHANHSQNYRELN